MDTYMLLDLHCMYLILECPCSNIYKRVNLRQRFVLENQFFCWVYSKVSKEVVFDVYRERFGFRVSM